MSRPAAVLLSALLPGAGHLLARRHAAGWGLAVSWTLAWHVILAATYLVPAMFPQPAVPFAALLAAASWLLGVGGAWRLSAAVPSEPAGAAPAAESSSQRTIAGPTAADGRASTGASSG